MIAFDSWLVPVLIAAPLWAAAALVLTREGRIARRRARNNHQ